MSLGELCELRLWGKTEGFMVPLCLRRRDIKVLQDASVFSFAPFLGCGEFADIHRLHANDILERPNSRKASNNFPRN